MPPALRRVLLCLSLTAYVGHIIAIAALGDAVPDAAALPALVGLVAAAVLLALARTRFFRRGPMEYLLYAATGPARLIS
ncbi:hypothetical protein [Streptomyces sp. NPDC059909]|uniref:hypothetical protein n=1 Tax=Streptomyces sp. NPDC059909 TaxID=3346998 RepID=UPI003661D29C